MPDSPLWILVLLTFSFGLIALAGALLARRIRSRGMSLCLVLAGLDDEDLARLTPQKLIEIDDELHDCSKQCDAALASTIGTVRQRVEHVLAKNAEQLRRP